jgi:uncharacterized membrane protein
MAQKRLHTLDIFRGWAIILMMVFHFSYDLNYFGYISVRLNHEPFWLLFRFVIVSIFLLSVGISLKLAHRKQIYWHKVKKRTFILLGASLIISLVTYFQFPKTWVYFGILHFIVVASLLALPFLSRPRLALGLAVAILLASTLGYLRFHELFSYLQPLIGLPKHTQDFVPFFPWFAVILLGMSVVHFKLENKITFNHQNFFHKLLAFLGRNALVVYLLHSPILFVLFMAVQEYRG